MALDGKWLCLTLGGRQVGSSAQAMVERVEWPGVEPSGLFDQHDQKIMGVVPTFATPSLLLPSLGMHSWQTTFHHFF